MKAPRTVLGSRIAFTLTACAAGPVDTGTVPRTSDENGTQQSNALSAQSPRGCTVVRIGGESLRLSTPTYLRVPDRGLYQGFTYDD